MHDSRTEGRLSNSAHAGVGLVMETAAECYGMADQCESQAATVHNDEARRILIEVAGKWRDLGNSLLPLAPPLH